MFFNKDELNQIMAYTLNHPEFKKLYQISSTDNVSEI